ncbi:MAG: DUF2157 domain-containing protein [Candidatus Andersenbacteria bacterium]|nr:DUF2157 domain-containing protein [Candidatus Andersenbacteria bacterium]
MEKADVLQSIRQLSQAGELSRQEVLQAMHETHAPSSRISEILYYIGGAIVCIGIAVLIGQNWEQLPGAARILSTLGVGVAAFVVAVLFSSRSEMGRVANAFWLVASVVFPIGLNVTFYQGGYITSTAGMQSVLFALLLAAWLLSYTVFRKMVLLLFAFVFGISFYYVFTSFLLGGRPIFDEPTFTEYRTLAVGLALCLLGYFFSDRREKALTGSLYTFGSLAFLGSALALGGYKPEQSGGWELLFPMLAFLFILGSVYIRSKSFLVVGSLALMGYIIKITTEYFSDSLGWPLALVVAGLSIIAIGYGSLRINKRFITKH